MLIIMLLYTIQILYVVLPRMLEEGEVDRSSCVYFVVDFLKTILELMFELHIHTEVSIVWIEFCKK